MKRNIRYIKLFLIFGKKMNSYGSLDFFIIQKHSISFREKYSFWKKICIKKVKKSLGRIFNYVELRTKCFKNIAGKHFLTF